MRAFAELYRALDATISTRGKLDCLVSWLREADDADAAWVVYFLAGGRPRRLVSTRALRALACEMAALPDWLFEASYQAVGDLAETIALLLPAPRQRAAELSLDRWMTERLLPLRGQAEEAVIEAVGAWWSELDSASRYLMVKLIGGGFRVGVSRQLVVRALAELAGQEPVEMAQRMMGFTDSQTMPNAERYRALLDGQGQARPGQPYPFFLAQPLSGEGLDAADPVAIGQRLGPISDWVIEGKYDGIRCQLIRRLGQTFLWSRGEELLSSCFPEVLAMARHWPDGTVVDGELLVWDVGASTPASFARLQTRLGRQRPSPRLLVQQPVRLLAYDLLEWQGIDRRREPLIERRGRLEHLAPVLGLQVSPRHEPADWAGAWALRACSRAQGLEGLMLKHRDSQYGVGRTRAAGLWFKWKVDPLTVDAVLIYAQAGHGRRASLYTDFTFAVWTRAPRDAAEAQASIDAWGKPDRPPDLPELVPVAKAYSGLSDEEFKRLDAIIRKSTRERFGPVRSVVPTQVFELGFEGIARSNRHRSGVALRFPRMLRWRTDKPVAQADTLASLQALLPAEGDSAASGHDAKPELAGSPHQPLGESFE
jgi:DNA ligase-1